MEVVEHAADPSAFVAELAARLAPGGLMILSTPNRTALSKLLLVESAERVGAVPRGTHDWDRRSEERHVGKECVSACRCVGAAHHSTNKELCNTYSKKKNI